MARTCRRASPRASANADAVPTQLHVVAQPTADDVQVIVDQARQYAPLPRSTLRVDGPAIGMISSVRPTATNTPFLTATALAVGSGAVERCEQPAVQNEIVALLFCGQDCLPGFMITLSPQGELKGMATAAGPHAPSPIKNCTTSAAAQNAGNSQPPPLLSNCQPFLPCTVTIVPR